MNARRSIAVEGFSHGAQPIPAAARVGPLLMTGGIYGVDPETGAIPDDAKQQTRLMFANLKRVLAAGGTSFDCVARMTIYVKRAEAKAALNEEWEKAFPDPASRPARHTLTYEGLPANMMIQCDATAFIGADAETVVGQRI